MGENLASGRHGAERRADELPTDDGGARGILVRPVVYGWAILGVLVLLAQGLWKLVPIALEAVLGDLSPFERAILWGFVVLNLYFEGYRGFQLRFVPRVVARALYLARTRSFGGWFVALAPLFVMGFFHAKRRARLSAWIVSALIALAVVIVRHLPAPWRGVVDAGVVAGLGYGTLAFVQQALTAAVTGVARV